MKSATAPAEKQIAVPRLLSPLSFLNSFPLRLTVAFFIAAPLSLLISSSVYPLVVPTLADQLAEEVAAEMGQETTSAFQTLRIITKHDLAWCYVTTSDGTVVPVTRPFAPNLSEYELRPREFSIRGFRYYETVRKLNDNDTLHIGVPLDQSWEAFDSSPAMFIFAMLKPIRLGVVLSTLALVFLSILALVEVCLCLPLLNVIKAAGTPGKTRQLSTPLGTVSEISGLVNTFKELNMQHEILKNKGGDEARWRERKVDVTRAQAIVSEPTAALDKQRSKVSPLMRSFEYELSSAQTSKVFAEQALGGLHERYPDVVTHAAFFKLDKDYQPTICASIGLADESLKMLQEVDHREIARGTFAKSKSADIGPMLIRRLGFEEIAYINSIRRILYFPIKNKDEDLAAIVIFLKDEEQVNADQLRAIERFRDQISNFFHKLQMMEEAEESDWTDQLTGLRNRQFFADMMMRVIEKSQNDDDKPVSLLMLSGDFLDAGLQNHDSDVRDRWMQEIARILRAKLDVRDRIELLNEPACYAVRYQGDEFAIVVENCVQAKALNIAEKIRSAMQANEQWAGGVRGLTVSIGCATFPENADSAEDLVAKARKALLYINEQMGTNKTCHVDTVPDDFKPSRRGSAFSGELGVLDCSGLLQSIAASQKTGLLSVQDDTGRTLMLTWEKGKPKQAKLGQLCGVPAIIEFVVTFETGTFAFQQRANAVLEGAGNEIVDSLERLLLEGALAEDHVMAAKRLIPNMDLLVRAVPGIDNAYRWLRLQEDREISKEELNVMRMLIDLADGTRNLSKIFEELQTVPPYMIWRAAGLLVENRLLQVKRL